MCMDDSAGIQEAAPSDLSHHARYQGYLVGLRLPKRDSYRLSVLLELKIPSLRQENLK